MTLRTETLPIVTMPLDRVGQSFIEAQESASHSRARWALRAALRPFAGDFALNGLLSTYPLHLLSTLQWAQLLGDDVGGRLLDVGAACGDVTRQLAPRFEHVVTTEVNRPMVRRLRGRGFETHLLDVTGTLPVGSPFDTVTALNVLDRCARPRTMLTQLVTATRPGGHLVVSVPLPFDPCWYLGPELRPPHEALAITGESFVDQARSLAAVVAGEGMDVITLARAPYLSGGDRKTPWYSLDAAIVVARRV